ncbi:MAG: hypothetical protein JWQ97_88, partial [Phenylobacterium sp.]|nr:hypothetical protein [Phenylobacterium sp.]
MVRAMAKAASRPPRAGPAPRFKKTSELIADELRARIARGEMVEGEALPNERALQEAFDVSRPTLREAMRILEAEGLLVGSRGGTRGARVALPTAAQAARYAGLILQMRGATVADVYALRTLVEPAAARMLAERAERPSIAPLRAVVEALQAQRANPREQARLLYSFDEILLGLSGNEALALLGQMMANLLTSQLHAVPDTLESLPARSVEIMQQNLEDLAHHRSGLDKTLDAIEAGDGALAEQRLSAWLRQSEDWRRFRLSDRLDVIR